MCRHLAYLGPSLPLAALLLDPPHSLMKQSWAPKDMRGGGVVNADGFGVGWYPPGADTPVRYRRDCPIWADAALPPLAQATSAGAVLAALRNATVGMPVMETAAAPFAEGPWLFSHNGVVVGWPDSVVGLAADLPVRDLMVLDAPTDAAFLWALVRHRLRKGHDLTASVVDTMRDVAGTVPGSRLNLLLTDGRTVVATAWWHALSVRLTEDSTLISSEPLDDDPAWQPVPDRHVVIATAGTIDTLPLTKGSQ